jgi:hypothetical protein
MEFNPNPEPVVYPIDATKAKSLEEMGVLFNALGIAMTEEYAKERGLDHMLIMSTKIDHPLPDLK